MIQEIKKNAEMKMQKSLENYKANLIKIRTGRPHAGMLDVVHVDYYGNQTPINQLSNITVTDSYTIMIKPWEAKAISQIEKAIRNSDLGLNPSTQGVEIRVTIPPLTEERRKELIKVVKQEAEEAKVAIRNVRRDANLDAKNKLKAKLITEDDDKRNHDEIQKLTDKFIIEVDLLTSRKEKELLTI